MPNIGARWLRCDLHVHTPFDGEKKFGENLKAAIEAFGKADPTQLLSIAQRFIDACRAAAGGAGIDLVALTDHNSIEGYKRLKPLFESIVQSLRDRGESVPVILPGVEFSVGGERPLHILVIFQRDTPVNEIEFCIQHVFTPRNPFDPDTGTPQATGHSVGEFLKKLDEYCRPATGDRRLSFVVIPAHVDGDNGLGKELGVYVPTEPAPGIWEEMRGHLREWAVQRLEWHGFQTKRPFHQLPEALRNLLCRWLADRRHLDWDALTPSEKERIRHNPHWPLLEASDPHRYEAIGARYTWLKMEDPDVEGIRLALLDPESRLRRMMDGRPGETYPVIRNLSIRSTDFFEKMDLVFNPALNALIGGRGTGKSTIIELLRYTLDRARPEDFDEDESEIRKAVLERLRTKAERDFGQTPGMLLPDHEIRVDVVIAGRTYRIIRNGNDPGPVVIPDPENNEHNASSLDVRTLIMPRILSQGQISRIARDPAAQRRELDALTSPDDRIQFEEERRRLLEEMEYLQVSRRKLKERRALLPAKETELTKVGDQVAFLEQGGNREILDRFRTLQKQRQWLNEVLEYLASAARGLEDQAAEMARLGQMLQPLPEGLSDEWLQTVALRAQERLATLGASLSDQAQALEAFHSLIERELRERWLPSFEAMRASYEQLKEEMSRKGIPEFEQHEKLLQRRTILEKEVAELRRLDEELDRVEKDFRSARRRLIALHEARFRRRQALATSLEEQDADIRLELSPYGDRRALQERWEDWFAGSGMQQRDWHLLVDYVYTGQNVSVPERLAELVAALRVDVEKTAESGRVLDVDQTATARLLGPNISSRLTGHFFAALQRGNRVRLDEMERFLPEDKVEAKVRGADRIFKPITQGSIGQRSTAILSLLLSSGDQPLIIDQPENDLDNQFVYNVIVDLLRKRKLSRQIIVASHNANIPVNGDAELIIALGVEQGLGVVLEAGNIDRPAVKEKVSDIMEGSAEAFRLRRERYGY